MMPKVPKYGIGTSVGSKNSIKKKRIVDSHSCHALYATINKNEIQVLKNRINCLSSTLNNCACNHSRLETLFQKKQAPHIHAHNPRHTYAHYAHIHTHSHMHARVYACTHCGRKGHLARFCFDRLNHVNLQIIIFGFHLFLTTVDPKGNRYQNSYLLCLT